MRSGIFESYGKYYLLSEVHDGHFGHLVKSGEVYNGVTIKADTSEASEGALSQESIDALKGLGYQFSSVTSVTGTQHVSDGKVTTGTETQNTNTQNTNTQSNQGNSVTPDENGLLPLPGKDDEIGTGVSDTPHYYS